MYTDPTGENARDVLLGIGAGSADVGVEMVTGTALLGVYAGRGVAYLVPSLNKQWEETGALEKSTQYILNKSEEWSQYNSAYYEQYVKCYDTYTNAKIVTYTSENLIFIVAGSLSAGKTAGAVQTKIAAKSAAKAEAKVAAKVATNAAKTEANVATNVAKGTGKFGSPRDVANLLDDMPELTGSNREKLLSTIKDSKLRNIANELYRPDASVGDGGTATKLIQELNDGVDLKHLQKAQNRLTELDALAKTGDLSLGDWDILDALRNDLEYALSLIK